MRESPTNPGLAGYNGTVWGVLMSVDDSKKMQRVNARGHNGEFFTDIERIQAYGFTSVPKPPEENGAKAPEVVIGFRGGIRSHPYILATDDRRYRFKNLKGGESAHHDDQGQNTHIARDGMNHTAKQHVMSATEGSKPLTTFELNEQIKGHAARTAQLEHNLHGLFDVTSRMREMVQSVVPSLITLAPILSQTPDGLTKMADAIQGKETSYLQTQIQQALDKFTSPTIGGIGSVMGGLDGIISAAEAKLASLVSANPVVATVDGLVDELAALKASGSATTIASMAPVVQGLIDAATAGNPVVAQVADLRSQLQALMASAGPGINFLGPQQRMVQGLTKSLKLSQ